MENVHVVIVYDCLDVLHTAVTHFNFISVEYLIKDVFWGNGYLVGVKRLTYSRCDTFTVWWIESYKVPLAIFVFVFLVTCAWGVVN